MHYTTSEFNVFVNSFSTSPGNMCGIMVEKEHKTGSGCIFQYGWTEGDSQFNRKFKKGAKSSFTWAPEAFVIRWPAEQELEMPDIPYLLLMEAVKAREIAMLEFSTVENLNPPQ